MVLHRRNVPDLVLSRATDLSEMGSFARLLAQVVSFKARRTVLATAHVVAARCSRAAAAC